MSVDFKHPLVGRIVVYRDPYASGPEQGTVTSVNKEANILFVRYGLGNTSAATNADERLTFLNGERVKL